MTFGELPEAELKSLSIGDLPFIYVKKGLLIGAAKNEDLLIGWF
jgi:hypothetical protein